MEEKEIHFADGIRQLYVPKLNKISTYSAAGLRTWLARSDNFIPAGINQPDCFEISLYDISESLSAWAGDIVRLACAAFETVDGITEVLDRKKFLAWQLVEYYYSAFYSAHCTLKICGFGLTQLDSQIIQNIKNRADTLGITFPNIQKGVYCVKINPNAAKITFYQINRYNDSHRGLWRRYVDFLNVLNGVSVVTDSLDSNCIRKREVTEPYPQSVYAQMPLQDAEIIVNRLEMIKKSLNKKGDCNWLSSIRNLINYNHLFGIWYPYRAYKSEYDRLVSMRSLYMKDPLSQSFCFENEIELIEFVKCCQIINAINKEIIVDLSLRNPENTSFLRNGPLAYMNLHSRSR